MKRAELQDYPDGAQVLLYDCPGCGMLHAVGIKGEGRPLWTWNGSLEAPTLTPSVLVTWNWGEANTPHRCHSFVRDGYAEILSDSTNEHAGKTLPIPPWSDA